MNYNNFNLTVMVLNDLKYLTQTSNLFQNSANRLSRKKEWSFCDWLEILFSGGLLAHSIYKTIDDGAKLLESFKPQPTLIPCKIVVKKRTRLLVKR
jgi:hypothetical protein